MKKKNHNNVVILVTEIDFGDTQSFHFYLIDNRF